MPPTPGNVRLARFYSEASVAAGLGPVTLRIRLRGVPETSNLLRPMRMPGWARRRRRWRPLPMEFLVCGFDRTKRPARGTPDVPADALTGSGRWRVARSRLTAHACRRIVVKSMRLQTFEETMASIDPGSVFRKTAKGVEEIDKRTQRLGIKLRMALILVNGDDAAEIIVDVRDNGGDPVCGARLPVDSSSWRLWCPLPDLRRSHLLHPSAAAGDGPEYRATQKARSRPSRSCFGPEANRLHSKVERCKSAASCNRPWKNTRPDPKPSRGESRAQKFWDTVTRKT